MAEGDRQTTRFFTPRRVLLQLLGFSVGLALLIWVIKSAAANGQWQKVFQADPKLVIALISFSLLSSILNGSTFWITVQPIKRLQFWHMQWLNLAGNMLNYAPIRLGAISRVMYHLRVDGLTLLQITAWFGMIFYVLMLGVGSCVLATLARPSIDWIWATMVVGQMILGGFLTRFFVGHPLIVKHGRGIDRMLSEHRPLWGAIILRLADIGAFTGRMAVALMILDITLPYSNIIILALVAFLAQLAPFARVGFRESCVWLVAARLGESSGGIGDNVPWEQLALIESAGEAIIFIPGGAIALLWYRKRWRESSKPAGED